MATALQTALAGLSNVRTPDFGDANRLGVAAGEQIQSGLNSLQGLAQEQTDIAKADYQAGVERNTQGALASLNKAAREAVAAGQDPSQIDPSQFLQGYGNQVDQATFAKGVQEIPQQIGSELRLDQEIRTVGAQSDARSALESIYTDLPAPTESVAGKKPSFELVSANHVKRVAAINSNPNLSADAKQVALADLNQTYQSERAGVPIWGEWKVQNLANGSSVITRTNDQGGYEVMQDKVGESEVITTPKQSGGFESTTTEKRYNELRDNNSKALTDGNQLFQLYQGTQDTALSSGIFGKTEDFLRTVTGSQDQASSLRKQWAGITNSAVLNALPAGPASDKDIVFAKKGVPDAFTNKAEMQQYLLGLAKISALDAAKSKWEVEYIDNNGSSRGLATAWGKVKNNILTTTLDSVDSRYSVPATTTETTVGSTNASVPPTSTATGVNGGSGYSGLWN